MPSRKTRSALKSHEHVSITFLMECSQRAISKTKTQTSHEHVSIKERGIMCDILKLKLNVQYPCSVSVMKAR